MGRLVSLEAMPEARRRVEGKMWIGYPKERGLEPSDEIEEGLMVLRKQRRTRLR